MQGLLFDGLGAADVLMVNVRDISSLAFDGYVYEEFMKMYVDVAARRNIGFIWWKWRYRVGPLASEYSIFVRRS